MGGWPGRWLEDAGLLLPLLLPAGPAVLLAGPAELQHTRRPGSQTKRGHAPGSNNISRQHLTQPMGSSSLATNNMHTCTRSRARCAICGTNLQRAGQGLVLGRVDRVALLPRLLRRQSQGQLQLLLLVQLQRVLLRHGKGCVVGGQGRRCRAVVAAAAAGAAAAPPPAQSGRCLAGDLWGLIKH